MGSDDRDANNETVRLEAADWFARLRAPDGHGDRPAFEAWYAADAANAEVYDRLVQRWEQTAFLANTPVGQSWRRRSSSSESVSQTWRYAAAAAIAATILITSIGVGLRHRSPAPPSERIATALVSRLGEIRTISLPDGSRVTLDTASVLGVAYSSFERRLILNQGRARFDVARDGTRPFIVSAGTATVTAHGTIFDVAVRSGRVQVTLLRGVVDVRQALPAGPQHLDGGRRLAAGQELVFEAKQALPMPLLAHADVKWTSGMLTFDATRLADAAAELNRYNRVQIHIAEPALGDLLISGGFRATDAAGFADTMAAMLDLFVSHDSGGDIVLTRQAPTSPP